MKEIHVVGAVIVNQEGHILCALRSNQMELSGMWEFPGGKTEVGETHNQTLIREIREELGCEIIVGEFVTDCIYEYPTVRVHLYTYYASLASGWPSPQEHEKLEWVPVERLNELNWAPADIPTVHKIQRDR